MRSKLLQSEVFKIRYIDRNGFDSPQNNLFSHEKKLKICAKIKQNPIKAVYLAPYLFFRSFFKKIHACRYSKPVKQKIKASPTKALYLVPYYLLAKLTFAKSWDNFAKSWNEIYSKYNFYRFYRNIGKEVHIPYFELVLTTRCTLRCESCANLMQYFSPQNAYTCTLQGITAALDALFSVVDSVKRVRIIGGEPLLFKDIAKVALYLDREPKVKFFDIVTNGTIKFKDDLLEVLANSKKCSVTISDYSVSPSIKIPLYYEQIIATLKAHNIGYYVIWQDENARWWDPEKIYKRGRSKENIIKNFKSCLMGCVSVMSNECLPQGVNNGGGGGDSHSANDSLTLCESTHNNAKNSHSPLKSSLNSQDTTPENALNSQNLTPTSSLNSQNPRQNAQNSQSKGQIFICPTASALSRLKGLGEFEGDFLELDETLSKEKILNFYAQDFFKACDYCQDKWNKNIPEIPIAIQTDKVLRLEKDE